MTLKSTLYSLLALTMMVGSYSHSESMRADYTVEANNAVGFKLMREATKKDSQKGEVNVMVSPISAHMALNMAYNGASGKTADDFVSFFNYPRDVRDLQGDVNILNNRLLTMLNTPEADNSTKTEREPKAVVVKLANSAFSTNGKTDGRNYQFQTDYLKTLKDYYSVEKAPQLDFYTQEAVDTINNWAKDNTNGMIPTIITQDVLKDLVWVLMNATYMEGQWLYPFIPYKAKWLGEGESNFTKLDGTKLRVDSLRSKVEEYNYYNDGKLEVVELPLVGENHYTASKVSVFVVLPSSSEKFLALGQQDSELWSESTWSEIQRNKKKTLGLLNMPKFAFDYEVTMKKGNEITVAMGLNPLFQDDATFGQMDRPDGIASTIGLIKQATKVEWTETGIKAAAVTLTGAVERTGGAPKMPLFQMNVDRPFYFAVYDNSTKTFLFLGSVVDPTQD